MLRDGKQINMDEATLVVKALFDCYIRVRNPKWKLINRVADTLNDVDENTEIKIDILKTQVAKLDACNTPHDWINYIIELYTAEKQQHADYHARNYLVKLIIDYPLLAYTLRAVRSYLIHVANKNEFPTTITMLKDTTKENVTEALTIDAEENPIDLYYIKYFNQFIKENYKMPNNAHLELNEMTFEHFIQNVLNKTRHIAALELVMSAKKVKIANNDSGSSTLNSDETVQAAPPITSVADTKPANPVVAQTLSEVEDDLLAKAEETERLLKERAAASLQALADLSGRKNPTATNKSTSKAAAAAAPAPAAPTTRSRHQTQASFFQEPTPSSQPSQTTTERLSAGTNKSRQSIADVGTLPTNSRTTRSGNRR